MDESTEELKANMEKAFAQRVEEDQRLTALADHLNSGKGTYVTAEEYAYQTGKVLSGVFREQITEEKLPEGVFTKEFVPETIEPLLKDDHKIVSTMAAVAQENINTAAGVHIQPQKADFNQDRADGFATKMDGKTMEEAGWMLGSPVTNFSQSIVDETMIKNGEVLAKAGKAATIKRQAEAKCCDWCLNKAGTYDATNREAYQRHRECRCEIEMHLDGSVKRQIDWKRNQWAERKESIKLNADSNSAMNYHKIQRGESKEIPAGGDYGDVVVSGKAVDFGDYKVLISDRQHIKPKEMDRINREYIRWAVERVDRSEGILPTIVLTDSTELTKSYGRYLFDSNTVFVMLRLGETEDPAFNKKVLLHELLHWEDCSKVSAMNPGLKENELVPLVINYAKKQLDENKVTEYNVSKYGSYAEKKWSEERYDEVHVEFKRYYRMRN